MTAKGLVASGDLSGLTNRGGLAFLCVLRNSIKGVYVLLVVYKDLH